MRQSGQAAWGGAARSGAAWDGAERERAEVTIATLPALRNDGESMAEVAHDARNMVSALKLYCELLEEPGVLTAPYAHYGSELRLVAAASLRLVEKLIALDTRPGTNPGTNPLAHPGVNALPPITSLQSPVNVSPVDVSPADVTRKKPVQAERQGRPHSAQRWDLIPALPIDTLAGELLANRNLLAALAGPTIRLTVDTESAALPVRLTGEDLTRVLVNLVKNSSEAMPAGGKINIRLCRRPAAAGLPQSLLLTIEDTGPGIPQDTLDSIFEAGFSTRSRTSGQSGWPATHRGLGLSITRSIIEAAGGRIQATNRNPAGARLEIELPVRT
jgi:signal transduction histidine kinase